MGDYVCPPKTVMALYNMIKSQKRIEFIQSATHSYFAPCNPKPISEFAWEEKSQL